MADISTKYLGLNLKNPVIASSSTLTDNLQSIKNLEQAGASAIVLRSIFEEEITLEADHVTKLAVEDGFEEGLFDYYDSKVKKQNVEKYIKLIKDAKSEISVPVIASINCYSGHEWSYFAGKIQDAGADALELNLFILPSDVNKSCEQNEKTYRRIIENVLKEVSIPVTLKISYYFSNLAAAISDLSKSGVKGLVLFNKFFAPDFDIEEEKVTPSYVLSNPSDLSQTLRWIAIMSERVECDLAASTGVHNGEGLVKEILAGAKAVQIASVLYKEGAGIIAKMNDFLSAWMDRKGYGGIEDFRGKMAYGKSNDPALIDRMQFMKYFGEMGK